MSIRYDAECALLEGDGGGEYLPTMMILYTRCWPDINIGTSQTP